MSAPTISRSDHREPPERPATPPDPSPRTRLLEDLAATGVWALLAVVLPWEPLARLWLAALVMLVLHRVVRRRPLALLTRRLPRVRRAPVEVAVIVLLVPLLTLVYLQGGLPSEDKVWTGTVVAAGVALLRLVTRRGLLAVVAVLSAVTVFNLATAPRLAADRSGDAALLGQLAQTHGYHRLSVAVIDLNSATPLRYANVGSTPRTPFETGSITKALTGLAIADGIDRGELRLDDPVTDYLPLGDSPAGRATVRELVTHSSGYPRVTDQLALRNGVGYSFGLNSEGMGLPQLEHEMRGMELGPRQFLYSNVGAAAVGQAAASAAQLSYPEWMQTRIFAPLQMTDTTIPATPSLPSGQTAAGRYAPPLVMDGYAPSGAAVSTSRDLARLAVALLDGAAPGMAALEPLANTDSPDDRCGILWALRTEEDGTVITWKNGKTQGYSSYIGLDRQHRRAVVVLADVNRGVDMLGEQLLSKG